MLYSFAGTVGVFTPRQGCSEMTKSSSAVVKTAERTIFRCRMFAGDAPAAASSVTHSRTWMGRMSAIFICLNHGMIWRFRTWR